MPLAFSCGELHLIQISETDEFLILILLPSLWLLLDSFWTIPRFFLSHITDPLSSYLCSGSPFILLDIADWKNKISDFFIQSIATLSIFSYSDPLRCLTLFQYIYTNIHTYIHILIKGLVSMKRQEYCFSSSKDKIYNTHNSITHVTLHTDILLGSK